MHKIVPTVESMEEILISWLTIQMKAIEQYFPVVLFTMLYKVVLTFESADEILKCDHSNESYWAILSLVLFLMLYKVGSNFWVCGWNPKVWPFKWKLLSSTFLWYCLLRCARLVLTFESLDEVLKNDHSNKKPQGKTGRYKQHKHRMQRKWWILFRCTNIVRDRLFSSLDWCELNVLLVDVYIDYYFFLYCFLILQVHVFVIL